MSEILLDRCDGSGQKPEQVQVRHKWTGAVEHLYVCLVCGQYVSPKGDGIARAHVNQDLRAKRLQSHP